MDRGQMARECLEIEKRGGDVLAFLRGKGCVSPWGTWHRLQKEELGRKDGEISLGKGKEAKNVGYQKTEKVKRTREENLDLIIEEIREQRDPVEALGKLGYSEPGQVYTDVKNWAKQNAPEKYAMLPANLAAWKKSRGLCRTETQELTLSAGENYVLNVAEDMEDVVITGIRLECGDYRVCNGYLYFGSNEKDVLEMPVEIWRKFVKELPKAMRILGVEVR